jgi:hypothetical protein
VGEPLIASFVVRIFGDVDTAADQTAWRVTVRHVQSDEEHQFTSLDEASAWMQQFAKEVSTRGERAAR